MELRIHDDAELAGAAAGRFISNILRELSSPALGLATGSSPIPLYRELIAQTRRGELDLSSVRAFILDEYVGLESGDPRRYRQVIRSDFTLAAGIRDDKLTVPDVDMIDLEVAAREYDEAVRGAAIDVQVLGLGSNGHIAFNEPGSDFRSATRVVTLSEQTRRDNARFFPSLADVPVMAVTQGLATISRSRHLVLMVSGESKAQALLQLVNGRPDSTWPATALQAHPSLTIFADRRASDALHSRSN